MLIDSLIPELVPSIRRAIEADMCSQGVEDFLEGLIWAFDYSILLGFLGAVLLGMVFWIGHDMVVFLQRRVIRHRV